MTAVDRLRVIRMSVANVFGLVAIDNAAAVCLSSGTLIFHYFFSRL